QGHHGVGTQAGADRVQPAALRRGLREADGRGVRRAGAWAVGEAVTAAGGGAGLRAQAAGRGSAAGGGVVSACRVGGGVGNSTERRGRARTNRTTPETVRAHHPPADQPTAITAPHRSGKFLGRRLDRPTTPRTGTPRAPPRPTGRCPAAPARRATRPAATPAAERRTPGRAGCRRRMSR